MNGSVSGVIPEMLEGSISGMIKSLGGAPVLETLNVNANGQYTPPSGVDGYNEVNVNVPERIPVVETLNVNANGQYTPPSGVDGYNEVNVNVPERIPVVETLNVNANGQYTPPSGVDGFNLINVNVPDNGQIVHNGLVVDISNIKINTKVKVRANYQYNLDFYMSGTYRNDGAILGTDGSASNDPQWTPYNDFWYYSNGSGELQDGRVGNYVNKYHNLKYTSSQVIFDNTIIGSFSPRDINSNITLGGKNNNVLCANTYIKEFKVTSNNELIYDFLPTEIYINNIKIVSGLYDHINNIFISCPTINAPS